MTIGRFRQVFLDNMPFSYDAAEGVFKSSSALSDERLTLQEVRRRGMIISLYEVATYDGVPYVYVPGSRMFYRLGNPGVQLSEDELELEERGGPRQVFPHGNAFRELVKKETEPVAPKREQELDR